MEHGYDRVVGYADFDHVDREALQAKIEHILHIVGPYFSPGRPARTLVAGCGEGSEAVLIGRRVSGTVYGVDVSLRERLISEDKKVELLPGDLERLPFEDGSFDFIYSYHVLEHVARPDAVLHELRRVLAEDGVVFIGFPNKHRAVAYIGTHTGETLSQKIEWNLNDYHDRLRGRFENELGAHAGFAQRSFMRRCRPLFEVVIPVRDEYMMRRYRRYASIVRMLSWAGLGEFVFPSNYYILRP